MDIQQDQLRIPTPPETARITNTLRTLQKHYGTTGMTISQTLTRESPSISLPVKKYETKGKVRSPVG